MTVFGSTPSRPAGRASGRRFHLPRFAARCSSIQSDLLHLLRANSYKPPWAPRADMSGLKSILLGCVAYHRDFSTLPLRSKRTVAPEWAPMPALAEDCRRKTRFYTYRCGQSAPVFAWGKGQSETFLTFKHYPDVRRSSQSLRTKASPSPKDSSRLAGCGM